MGKIAALLLASWDHPGHIDSGDLVSYGSLGLLDAISKFEPARGVKFETFAKHRIRGAIIDGVRVEDPAPRAMRARARRVRAAETSIAQRTGLPPTVAEIASHAHLSCEQVRAGRSYSRSERQVRLDSLVELADGFEVTLAETIACQDRPDQDYEMVENRDRFAERIAVLPERERIVFTLYYALGLTLKEIGELFGTTESTVSQIQTRALLTLRSSMLAIAS